MKKAKCFLRNGSLFGALVLLSLTSSPVLSQQRISIGPRIGVNLSDFQGDINNNRMLTGWSIGGFIMYSDINHFGISGDLLFSQKGAKFENQAAGANRVTYNQRINYLEIPVLARYFLNKSGNFRPNLFIGPSVAFKLNAQQNEYRVNDRIQPDRDNSDQYRAADIGLVGGMGLNFQIAPGKRVLIDARYTHGLSDATVAAGTVRNSSVTLNLSYGFGI